jgi:hypothetical protein
MERLKLVAHLLASAFECEGGFVGRVHNQIKAYLFGRDVVPLGVASCERERAPKGKKPNVETCRIPADTL